MVMYMCKPSTDLLDEIECDPEFGAPEDENSEQNYLRQRLDAMQFQNEAILLIFRATEFVSEELYQMAITHLMRDAQYIATKKIIPDGDFIRASTRDFIANARHLDLLPISKHDLDEVEYYPNIATLV